MERRQGREGVINAIFKKNQLKFLDVEKEPSPQLTISSHRFQVFLPGLPRITLALKSIFWIKEVGTKGKRFFKSEGTHWGIDGG
jgi:hypothetical protein